MAILYINHKWSRRKHVFVPDSPNSRRERHGKHQNEIRTKEIGLCMECGKVIAIGFRLLRRGYTDHLNGTYHKCRQYDVLLI